MNIAKNVFVPLRGTSCFSKKVQKNSFAETILNYSIPSSLHKCNVFFVSFTKRAIFSGANPLFFRKKSLNFLLVSHNILKIYLKDAKLSVSNL